MNYPSWLLDIVCDPQTKLPLSKIVHDRILSLVYPSTITGENLKMNRIYDQIAPFYHVAESIFGWLMAGIRMKRERQKIISLMKLKSSIRLLEVSSGSGVFQPLLREALGKDAEIASIDLSMHMLEQCRKQHGHLQIPLIHANAEYLPFVDQSFDAVFHIGGINRFNHPEIALADFVRVVRSGGLVAWGDEHMSEHFKHPIGRWLLPKLNPGIYKPIPPVPAGLQDVKHYEVYNGIAYFFIGTKI